MMRQLLILLGSVSYLVSTVVSAQTCLTNIPATTPEAEFSAVGTAQVKHQRTGLVWARCALGQEWDGTACLGDAQQLTWQQALIAAHGAQVDQTQGWRLPNLKELSSLTERQCVRPSINAVLFPGTPEDDFWTSTPSVSDPDRAWVVAFTNSSNAIRDKQRFVFVRLVRTALPNE